MGQLPSRACSLVGFPGRVSGLLLGGVSAHLHPCYSTCHTHFITNCSEDHPHCEYLEGSNSILYILSPQCEASLLLLPTRWKTHTEWINGQAKD